MEAVAAVASIAGIITVVGQSIDGLIKFSDFFSDLASASKTISRLLSDINSLIQVLEDIGDVLERAKVRRKDKNLANLDVKLEDCAKDVQIWLATARLLRPSSDSGGKAWLRKFRLAVNTTAVQTIRDEIARHKQTLCLSLAVFGRYKESHRLVSGGALDIDRDFRTIDIDISAQVHQIGGRFSEALSTSLSVNGAHEEALRRIEHYSMTSMHSSAHSIRSMDSIRTEFRTELSRLEAMISSTSNVPPTQIEIDRAPQKAGSSRTEGAFAVVSAAELGGSNLLIAGQPPEHNRDTSDPSVEVESHQESMNDIHGSLDRTNRSQRTRDMAVGQSTATDSNIDSKKLRSSTDEIDDNDPTQEVNKVSDLYAEFSKKSEPRPKESKAIEPDCAAIHLTLQQSLATIYPPEVVRYVSLRQVTTLCEDHIDFLDRSPSILISAIGKMKETSYIDDNTSASAGPSLVKLKDRLVELEDATKITREKCTRAGYSLLELDKILPPPGTGRRVPAQRPPPRPAIDSADDSSSLYSEDFHSPAE